jgi:hypothetical protein
MAYSYDHELIARLRGDDWAWADIAVVHYPGATSKQLVQAHSVWKKYQQAKKGPPEKEPDLDEGEVLDRSIQVAGQTFARMQSIEDVVRAFDMDPRVWEAVHVKVGGSSWDQSVEKGTVASSVRIDASFRRIRFHEEDAKEVWTALREDFTIFAMANAPNITTQIPSLSGSEPALAVIAIHDPHFGMLAWGKEVGEDQDLRTIEVDYTSAAEHLISVSRIYPVARYLYTVGQDMGHTNQAGEGGKGGATKRGTPQDIDGRQAKTFVTMARCAIAGIDLAAALAPTDVVVVPGNHDPDESFRLGEVLAAWYRSHPNVRVFNAPRKRKFYNYGANTFMLTHGEEFTRKRDNLVTIMAAECPADWWVASERGCREILTGHNHRRLQGGYYPTAEVEESRGVVVRSLPGLTATDAWHYEEGYKHRRAATLLAYKESGGILGLHEYSPVLRIR